MEETGKYKVTIYFSYTFEVEAQKGNEKEARHEAYKKFKDGLNCVPIPDDYEVECLDEDD